MTVPNVSWSPVATTSKMTSVVSKHHRPGFAVACGVANYALLCASSVPEAGPVDFHQKNVRVFEAKYNMPVLWLALFEPGDIAKNGHGSTTQAAALATWQRRRRGLVRIVGDEFAPLITEWGEILAEELAPYIHIDVEEVLAMGDETFGGWHQGVYAALEAAVAGPLTPADRSPLSVCGLGPKWRENEFVESLLAGSSNGWPIKPEERVWRAAMRTTNSPAKDFEPRTVLAKGDVVRHLLHGDGVVIRIDGSRSEVVFRSGTVTLGRASKPVPDPFGPTTPLGRFLEAPHDEARRAAYRAVADDTRGKLMDRAGDVYGSDPDIEKQVAQLVGPLARVIDTYYVTFRRGFVSYAGLMAPYDVDRGRAFLHRLGPSGTALLHHPLWRTLETLEGEDDDIIAVATHPNFIALRHVSISLDGLARLSRWNQPVRILSATSGSVNGLDLEDKDGWRDVLAVGALQSLETLELNLRPFEESGNVTSPSDLAWLLESSLGQRLRGVVLHTQGEMPHSIAAWHAALLAHPSLAHVDLCRATTWIRIERERVVLASDGKSDLDVADCFVGVVRDLRTIVGYNEQPCDGLIEELREHLDDIEPGPRLPPVVPPVFELEEAPPR